MFDAGNWDSNIKFQISNIEHQISNIKHQTSNIKHQTSNIEYQTSNIEHQTSNIKMKWICVLICVGVAILTDAGISSYGSGTDSAAPVFSLDVRDESLENVLEKISGASGYRIVLRGEGGDVPVTVKLKDVSLEEMLRRVLRKLNHTLIWDDAEKKVSLSLYASTGKSSRGTPMERDRTMPVRIFPGHQQKDRSDFGRNVSGREEYPDVSITGEDTHFVQGTDTTD
ncbi:MAG TPA: hypothetical protein ENK58_09425 [Desulfobacterales bacterium]|nr:hypothetical protein [Desulfobacterales bacterium]